LLRIAPEVFSGCGIGAVYQARNSWCLARHASCRSITHRWQGGCEMRVNKILAPTDFSDVSKLGLRHALELARRDGAEVIVYHVIDFDGDLTRYNASRKGTRHLLDRTREALGSFLRAHFADS